MKIVHPRHYSEMINQKANSSDKLLDGTVDRLIESIVYSYIELFGLSTGVEMFDGLDSDSAYKLLVFHGMEEDDYVASSSVAIRDYMITVAYRRHSQILNGGW